jgi:hypothetical protein
MGLFRQVVQTGCVGLLTADGLAACRLGNAAVRAAAAAAAGAALVAVQ